MRILVLLLGLWIGLSYAEQGPGEPISSISRFDDAGNGWSAFDETTQSVVDGKLTLTSPSFAMTQFETRLVASGIQVTADFSEAMGVIVALRSQPDPSPNGYFLEVLRSGAVLLYLVVDGQEQVLGEMMLQLEAVDLLNICLRSEGRRLRGWIWPSSMEQPEKPSIAAIDSSKTFTQGRPRLGIREGKVAFTDVSLWGERFRPQVLRVSVWKPEPRIVLVLETVPGSVHRFQDTVDRSAWQTRYLIEANPQGNTTTVVVPGSFQESATPLALTRVIDATTNEGTLRKRADFLFPTTVRFALTWESQDNRLYGFEYSPDLVTWQPVKHVTVRAADGQQSTATVLALPQKVAGKDPLYWRVIER